MPNVDGMFYFVKEYKADTQVYRTLEGTYVSARYIFKVYSVKRDCDTHMEYIGIPQC